MGLPAQSARIPEAVKSVLFNIYRWVLWNLISRLLFVEAYLRPKYRFNRSGTSQPYPKAPFLIIANHGTFFDPWFVGSYSVTPVNYMTNDDGFRDGPITRWYLKSIGAFPKKKGAADYRAMKITLDLLKKKSPVCIFPEGQTTWDGETQLLYPGIEKLVKRTGCPLVAVRIKGNFLAKPWWARTPRTGRIILDVKVYQPEEIRAMSNEELFAAIRQSIYQNDIKDPDNRAVQFKGTTLAAGLERFLWICLGCGSEDTLSPDGNRMVCSSCGHTVELDANCRFILPQGDAHQYADLKDWADLHKAKVRDAIARKPDLLTRSTNVVLQQENDRHCFVERDRGTMTLSPELLRFEGANVNLSLPVAEIEDCVIQKKDFFELRHGTIYHRFLFSGHSPMKWVYYLRYLKGFEKCEAQGHL